MIKSSYNRPFAALSVAALFLLVTTGCAKSVENSAASNNGFSEQLADNGVPDSNSASVVERGADTAAVALPTDAWTGKWVGPEGLFLTIQPVSGAAGHYTIVNRDTLDREASYSGIAEGATIRFVRDSKDLVIRPGSGDDTGFKWLAGKKDCLIVIRGQEGYCR
ncbi:MAG: hypothetical protein ABW048_08440 [Sphingobium sp.]